MFGLSIKGDDGQIVITDGVLSLSQKFTGRIVITTQDIDGIGKFTFTYPVAIVTNDPPMVFAVPTHGCSGKGIGGFAHIGEPGAWSGFSALVAVQLFMAQGGSYVGFDSGWEYRVCVFGDPELENPDKYGVRMYGANRKCYYDSAWPIVPFIGLMGAWELSDFTRSYDLISYGGFRSVIGDSDAVLAKGHHVWGWVDGATGFLLSGTGRVPVRIDIGKKDITVSCMVFLGFTGADRTNIWSVVKVGQAQHPGGDVSWLSNWKLLLADFSGV
jgi:hypothetical protein